MGLMGGGGTAPGPGGPGTTTARSRRPGLSAARVREALTGYALVAPGLIGVLLFVIVPAGALVWLSARKWGLLSDPEFVGPSQAGRVLADPEFLTSLRVTLLLALLVVPAQIALGLLLAVLLAKGVRGTGLLRALVIIPWAASPLALGVVWSWMLAPAHGSPAGPPGASTGVLASPTWALPAVALVVIWTGAGHTAARTWALVVVPGAPLTDAREISIGAQCSPIGCPVAVTTTAALLEAPSAAVPAA